MKKTGQVLGSKQWLLRMGQVLQWGACDVDLAGAAGGFTPAQASV